MQPIGPKLTPEQQAEQAELQRQAILADEARKMVLRYTQPVYRFEVLYRPCPEVPSGTTATVIFTLSGKEQQEELVYQGHGRWLNRDFVEWLSAPED
jgi:hypothetical protein